MSVPLKCERLRYAMYIASIIIIALTVMFIFGFSGRAYVDIVLAVMGFFFGAITGRLTFIMKTLKVLQPQCEKIRIVYIFTVITILCSIVAYIFGLPSESVEKIIITLLSYLAGVFTGGGGKG